MFVHDTAGTRIPEAEFRIDGLNYRVCGSFATAGSEAPSELHHPLYFPAAVQPVQWADAGVEVIANEEVCMRLGVPSLHLDGMQIFRQGGVDLGDVRRQAAPLRELKRGDAPAVV